MRQFSLSFALIFSVLFLGSLCQVTPPVWPSTWQASFNESMRDGPIEKGSTTGVYFYDFANNRSRIDRVDGKYDRYCGTEEIDVSTPCSQVVVEKEFWLLFEERQKCCRCCTDAEGCGVVSPDWLNGAKYDGEFSVAGYVTNRWEKEGNRKNFYYSTVIGNFPLIIDMEELDKIQYDPSTYTTSPIDDSHFVLPGYCTDNCLISIACDIRRAEASEIIEE